MDKSSDSTEYLKKKAFFDKVLTIYGRHAVMEALKNDSLELYRLHLSESNKSSRELDRMVDLAQKRSLEIAYHDKKHLSRISGNARQDQGVALDVMMDNFIAEDEMISQGKYRIIALDSVTNPQNLGMIIRSCAAGNIDALLLPKRGTAGITPLVIQASAGTIFKLPIIKTNDLRKSLVKFAKNGSKVFAMDASSTIDYRQSSDEPKGVYVLGNESKGISHQILSVCTDKIAIPMNRGVESLNVAVTASLIAFM